ncbi:MAG: gamma-glutamyltransferase [Gammaproteobacteria bacterium]|nr:gamma-glutamyltransferase [Gammaproteobacteria bacterium]MDH3410870.1 gamma-glutamyltransferase [Gammaproteobacteria bacterium]
MNKPEHFSPRRHGARGILYAVAAAITTVALLGPAITAAGDKASLGIPGVRGGVVTTSEPAAARAGRAILEAGGNAIDAAAAVAFALNVVEPQSSGIGGGGFMIIYLAKQKQTVVVDSRESTPAAGDPQMFLDSGLVNAFPFSIRSTSGIGVGVPGMVRGLELALNRWGTMSFSEVLGPAIDLAENGFRVSERLAESILSSRLDSEPTNLAYQEARNVFRPGGVPLQQNDLLVQPALADTLMAIATGGADAFYTGPIADAIVATQLNTRTFGTAADQQRLQGRMTLQDLADYQAAIREPVVGNYRGFTIVSMPPPSSGGLTVIQILKLIERFPIGDEEAGFGFGSKRTLNVMMEAMRLAFADRAVWMGDEDFVDVPSEGLLDDDYIALRSALIDPDARQPTDSVEADDPRPFEMAQFDVDEIQLAMAGLLDDEGLNTTHFSIVDRDGNIVTYTNTIESAWGTGLMVPDRGFLLNNELTDFNSSPAFNPDPNNFNPGANDAAAGKRPRSSMSPTLIFKDKKPLVALGSPGGSTIINSVTNVTMNLIDHDRNAQEAVDLPRISQTSANGSPNWEAGFDEVVIDELEALGHNLSDSRLSVIGSVQVVAIGGKGKRQYGAGDRRRIGAVESLRRGKKNKDHKDDDD